MVTVMRRGCGFEVSADGGQELGRCRAGAMPREVHGMELPTELVLTVSLGASPLDFDGLCVMMLSLGKGGR